MKRKYGNTTETEFVQFPYSTVTDWSFPTPGGKFIPFLSFVCVIIYCKGLILSTEYKDFDIIFIEKC